MATGEEMLAQYNPDELTEVVTAKYKTFRQLGAAPFDDYEQTDREEYAITLYFDDRETEGRISMGEYRRFIKSLLFPRELPNGDTIDPPQVFFVWSKLLAVACRVMSARFRHTRFDEDLMPEVFTVDLTLKECGLTVVTSEIKRNEFVLI